MLEAVEDHPDLLGGPVDAIVVNHGQRRQGLLPASLFVHLHDHLVRNASLLVHHVVDRLLHGTDQSELVSLLLGQHHELLLHKGLEFV